MTNDLAIRILNGDVLGTTEQTHEAVAMAVKALSALPSAEEETFEWCHDCKEYDQSAHCCHRWTKVIRNTVEEIRNEQRWIPVSERLPEQCGRVIVTIRGSDCIVCNKGESMEDAIERVSKIRRVTTGFIDSDGWYDGDGYPIIAKVIAWMPLPEPYKDGDVK